MAIQFHTQTFTRFTDPSAAQGDERNLVYSAEKWVRVILTLTTAGPVLIGTQQNLNPAQPGQGIVLQQDVATPIVLPRGDRLYMASTSIDAISVVIEPIPWLEEITALLCKLTNLVQK